MAVLAGIHAARPRAGDTVAVTVAAHDLVSGTVLGRSDVATRRFPAGSAPAGARIRAVGRTLAGPVRAGEPITDVRLVTPGLVAGYPGRVGLRVRVADADAVRLLRVGDHIDLVAADPRDGSATYAAVDVPVLALPPPGDPDSASGGVTGRLVVVAALPSDVDVIAGAAATAVLSVVISP